MKLLKASASLLAIGLLTHIASAQVYVNVVGSTAFRTFVTEAEYNVLSTPPSGDAAPTAAYVDSAWAAAGSSFSNGGAHSAIHGFLSDGTEVIFRNFWTGSLAGVVDLTQGTSDPFIPTSFNASYTDVATTNGAHFTPGTYDSVAPNVAFTDAQSSDVAAAISSAPSVGSSWASTIGSSALQNAGASGGGASTHTTVGLVNFQWVIGNIGTGNTPPFSNITAQQASALVSHGIEPLSFFTGSTSDATNYVVFIGRNEDSGTRILYDAESQGGGLAGTWEFGQATTQFEIQQNTTTSGYGTSGTNLGYPTSNTTGAQIAGVEGFRAWPRNWALNTEPSANWLTTGHSGYLGGGDVAKVLESLNPVTTSASFTYGNTPAGFVKGTSKVYIVSCLGASDAKTAVAGGASYLSYNGVIFSVDTAGVFTYNTAYIASGLYTAWGYEHEYYLTSASGSQAAIGTSQGAADALADSIYGTTTATLLPVGTAFTDLVISRGQTTGVAPQ